MSDSSSQTDRPLDHSRSRATVRTLSDKDLTELHAQGREALRPGAWEVLDEELRRRARTGSPPSRSLESDEERYPAIRTTVFLLKALAVLILVAGLLATIVAAGAKRGFGLFPLFWSGFGTRRYLAPA